MKESTAVATVDHATQEIARHGHTPTGIEVFLDKIDSVSRAARALAEGGFYGIRDANVMGTIILQAMELRVPVGVAAKNIYTFRGNVGMMGALMLGLAIERCGISVEQIERTPKVYRGIMRRRGWADMPLFFDEEMALAAKLLRKKDDGTLVAWSGKGGDSWDDWRQDMLQWKAINAGLRVMGADYFAMHQIHDYETVQMMAHEDLDAHRLDASEELRKGVEPHPDTMTEDEINQLATELFDAERAGVITNERRNEIADLGVKGQWTECRAAWEEVRGLMLRAEAEA